MRSLGATLLVAWLSIGLHLLWPPSGRLEFELAVSKDFLEDMKNSPLRNSPEFQESSDYARRLVSDPSRREIVIWATWSALLLLVGFGLWTAHVAFHRHSRALMLVLFGSLLFVGRQAVFYRATYAHLFDDKNPVIRLLKSGNYKFAFSIIWYHYLLVILFFSLALYALIQLAQRRARLPDIV
jgi:uncharacterized membrane protein YozB (DUF420 family)